MSDLVTINTDNYAVMAKAMGIAGATVGTKTSNNLNRLRIWHSPIMGEEKVGNKLKKVEVVEGGVYRLELVDDDTSTYYYAKTATVRPFMQRYMLKRYESFSNVKEGDPKGTFHKTIMSDNLNTDLKDNKGNFNCGKPAGYIKDFKALPVHMQDLIKQTKRVRVVFGTIKLNDVRIIHKSDRVPPPPLAYSKLIPKEDRIKIKEAVLDAHNHGEIAGYGGKMSHYMEVNDSDYNVLREVIELLKKNKS